MEFAWIVPDGSEVIQWKLFCCEHGLWAYNAYIKGKG